MILCDRQIAELAQRGMITSFTPELIRESEIDSYSDNPYFYKVISYGLSSYGYDIRLSSKEFKIFKHIPGTIINPKEFNPDNLEAVELHHDKYGDYFILPGHSYGLGVAVEKIEMPPDITAICLTKSTYARVAIAANLTPIESQWRGHLTIEISNNCSADCRIYANEGIAQLLFFRGEPCSVSYEDRKGKYQDQPERIVFAKA
jgi:dCTP deaminase